MSEREFNVSVRYVREHFATVTVRAGSQEEADEKGLDLFNSDLFSEHGGELGLARRWDVYEPREPTRRIHRRNPLAGVGGLRSGRGLARPGLAAPPRHTES